METSLIALIMELLGKAAKTKEGRSWVFIILLVAFVGFREWQHAQEKDALLIANQKKMETLLETCEKTVAKHVETIEKQRDKIGDLRMDIAIRDLK